MPRQPFLASCQDIHQSCDVPTGLGSEENSIQNQLGVPLPHPSDIPPGMKSRLSFAILPSPVFLKLPWCCRPIFFICLDSFYAISIDFSPRIKLGKVSVVKDLIRGLFRGSQHFALPPSARFAGYFLPPSPPSSRGRLRIRAPTSIIYGDSDINHGLSRDCSQHRIYARQAYLHEIPGFKLRNIRETVTNTLDQLITQVFIQIDFSTVTSIRNPPTCRATPSNAPQSSASPPSSDGYREST